MVREVGSGRWGWGGDGCVREGCHCPWAVSTGPSGVVCSTPLVGRRERKDVNPSILVSELIHSGRNELQGNDKLVERFVYKYFYKWMYQL